jgi:hypothetical protein
MTVKRNLFALAAAAVVLAGAGGSAAAGLLTNRSPDSDRPAAESVVMRVNGEPVTQKEFQFLMKDEMSAVTTYFQVKHGADDGPNYWTTSFGGETPLDVLKQRSYKKAVEGKVMQEIAREQGLIQDISFSRIERDWEAYNASRKQRQTFGGIIYGLDRFSFRQYYSYYMSQLRIKLEKKLGQEELRVTDGEVRAYYDTHPELYRSRQAYTVSELYIPYDNAGNTAGNGNAADAGSASNPDDTTGSSDASGISNADMEAAYRLAEQARKELAGGMDAEQAAQRLGRGARAGERVLTAAQTPGNAPPNVMTADPVAIAASKLKQGELSGIIDTGSGYSLIRLLKADPNAAVPLEGVAAPIKSKLLQQKFDAYLAERVQTVNVTIDEDNYARISVDE